MSELWWYTARAGGIVSLALAAGSIVWGLLLTSRLLDGRPKPAWLLDLHRWLGALTVIFTIVHVVALWMDSYIQFSVADLLIPFVSDWNPGAVAWGIVSMYLLAAVQISSLAMKRIPRKLWRWIHFASYAMFTFGAVHGLQAGTDAAHPLYVGGTISTISLIVYLTIHRIITARSVRRAVATQATTPTAQTTPPTAQATPPAASAAQA